MSYFVNRRSKNINRRRLEIQNVERNSSGELVEIVADVFRDEESVAEKGTALNAEELNAIFEQMRNLIFFLYDGDDLIQVDGSLKTTWTQEEGKFHVHTFRVNLKKRLYAKAKVTSTYLVVSVTDYQNYVDIEVKETDKLNKTTGSITRTIDYDIEFYTDSSMKNYLTKIQGTVNYINTSTNPID